MDSCIPLNLSTTLIWSIECIDGDSPGAENELIKTNPGLGTTETIHTTMYTEDLVVYDNRQRQEVKHVCEVCPDVRRTVLPDTFRIKPI